MKKIIKWSLLIGLVICLMGVGMITAGAMMGGGEGLVSYLGTHHAALGWYDDWNDGWHDDWNDDNQNRDERRSGDLSGQLLESSQIYEGIRELEIEGAVGSVEIVEEKREDPDDQTIWVARYGVSKYTDKHYTMEQDRDELKITFTGLTRNLRKEEVETVVIYVPEGYRFRKVDVEMSAGSFFAQVMYADEADLTLRAGKIVIGGGGITDLDVECQAGSLECQAQVSRNAEVECQAGSVNIWLAGTKDQYNYELECSTGTIRIEGEESYTGIRKKKYIDHRAANQVDLECAAGEITVNFAESV